MPGKDRQMVLMEAESDSFDQMHNALSEAIQRLAKAIIDTSFELLYPTMMQSEWTYRIERVSGIPGEIRDNEEALAHWKTLQDIAQSNYDQTIGQLNSIKDRRDVLRGQKKELSEALARLIEAQKKDAFHANMRSLARSAGQFETSPYDTLVEARNREITRLIHTADALIEIKKDDAV